MDSKRFIAVMQKPLEAEAVRGIVGQWMDTFPRVEQVCPGPQAGPVTVTLQKPANIIWEKNLQFRVLNGEDFSWIYLTLEERVIETSGLDHESNTLPLDVLVDIEGIDEVIDQKNERRLDELEKTGIL